MLNIKESNVNLICIFPLAQQVVGLGMIVSNSFKCLFDIFLMLTNAYTANRYNSQEKYCNLRSQIKKIKLQLLPNQEELINLKGELKEIEKNESLNDESKKIFTAFKTALKAKSQLQKHAENIGIGLIRFIPGVGTILIVMIQAPDF